MALPTDAELLATARTDASAFRDFYERYADHAVNAGRSVLYFVTGETAAPAAS